MHNDTTVHASRRSFGIDLESMSTLRLGRAELLQCGAMYGDDAVQTVLERRTRRGLVTQVGSALLIRDPNPSIVDTAHVEARLRTAFRNQSRRSALARTAGYADVEDHHVIVDVRAESTPAALEEALATLPERDREVLRQQFVDEAPISACAEALGISSGAFRVASHRARRHLRLAVAPYVFVDGMDFTGKSTAVQLALAATGSQHRQKSLLSVNPWLHRARLARQQGASEGEIVELFVRAAEYDVSGYRTPRFATIQESAIAFKSLALLGSSPRLHAAAIARLHRVIESYPEFDKVTVLTVSAHERMRRLRQRQLQQPTAMTQNDRRVLTDPAGFLATEERLLAAVVQRYPRATVLDTTHRSPAAVAHGLVVRAGAHTRSIVDTTTLTEVSA